MPSSERADKQQKVWVGDGLPASIPKELHSRIIEWQFIDLAELRPPSSWDVLQADPQDAQKLLVTPNLEISRSRKKTIKDILTWTQCFTVYMAVLAKAEPDCITELAAYMLTIITAAQDYEHPSSMGAL